MIYGNSTLSVHNMSTDELQLAPRTKQLAHGWALLQQLKQAAADPAQALEQRLNLFCCGAIAKGHKGLRVVVHRLRGSGVATINVGIQQPCTTSGY